MLSSRVSDWSPRLLDELAAAGEVAWVGAGPLGRDDGKVLLFLRGQAAALRPVTGGAAAASGRPTPSTTASGRSWPGGGRASSGSWPAPTTRRRSTALWDLVWAGEVTNDSFAALRAFVAGGVGVEPALGQRQQAAPPRFA